MEIHAPQNPAANSCLRHIKEPLALFIKLNLVLKAVLGFFLNYLKERNCLRDKFSRFSRIFAKFTKLNLREKFNGSQFTKLNPREKKKIIFRIRNRLHQVLYQLTMVMSKIFFTRQHRKKNVNHFIISALFDLHLGIQSIIKSFITR